MSNDSCIELFAKNKAAIVPITFEEIVMVMIRRITILWGGTRLSISNFCGFLYQFFTSACTAFVGDFALNPRNGQRVKLIYSVSLMSVPDTVKNTAQGLRFSFLWKNRKDKIKGKVVCQQLKNGDLNFINFGIMMKYLR